METKDIKGREASSAPKKPIRFVASVMAKISKPLSMIFKR